MLSHPFGVLEDSVISTFKARWMSLVWFRSNRQFIQVNRNWIKTPCRRRRCQILLPGHFLWGNSQHVGCKDHFYTTHSQDRPLILDDFSETQITFSDNILERRLPDFFHIIFFSQCLLTTNAGWRRFVRFGAIKLSCLCYGEAAVMEDKRSHDTTGIQLWSNFRKKQKHLCDGICFWRVHGWGPNGVWCQNWCNSDTIDGSLGQILI